MLNSAHFLFASLSIYQIISSVDSAKDILAQVEEAVIPIISLTLEQKMLSMEYLTSLGDIVLILQ